MAAKLALFGGSKVRENPFPPHPIVGEAEKRAVTEVLESGTLSFQETENISTIAEFVRNPAYTQYVNLEEYDFMKEAVYGS